MKDKLGTKIYRQNVLKPLADIRVDTEDNCEKIEVENSNFEKFHLSKNTKHKFSRVNRGYPIEASSKKIDYRFDFSKKPTVSGTGNSDDQTSAFDPRFNPQIGEYKEEIFKKNYAFIDEMKRSELETLKKQLKKCKTEETRQKLKFLIQRTQNQIKSEEEKQKKKALKEEVRSTILESSGIMPNPRIVDGKKSDEKQLRTNKKVYVNKCKLLLQ